MNGDWLTLTFSEPLHFVSPGAFSVAVDGAARGVRVSVTWSHNSNMVKLGLASAVVSGETVTVGYTVPNTVAEVSRNLFRTSRAIRLQVSAMRR